MGKGVGGCKGSPKSGMGLLSAGEEQALQYADDLQKLRDSFGPDVDVAELVTPASDEELERLAKLYGSQLSRKHGMATLGRGAKHTQQIATNEEIFRRMIDLNVIQDMSVLKEFSRQAGIVLRHHPDYAMRRQAAGMLIFCNERMAQKIARKYHHRWKNFGFSFEDMFQEAQIGMAEAAEDRDGKRRRVWEDYRRAMQEWEESGEVLGKTKPSPPKESDVKVFDPDKASFLTFAMQKINMRIGRMVEHNSEQRFGHRVSTEKFHQVGKVLYEKGLLEVNNKDNITAEMLLKQPGMAEFETGKTQKERLALCQDCLDLGSMRSVRLNERVRSGDDSEYTERGALMSDYRQDTAGEATDKVVNKEMKTLMKGCLNDEEMHYIAAIDLEGMYSEWPAANNDEELAQRLGVKPSRVKSIRKEARKKLRGAMKTAGWEIPA